MEGIWLEAKGVYQKEKAAECHLRHAQTWNQLCNLADIQDSILRIAMFYRTPVTQSESLIHCNALIMSLSS